jgi:hypothetical protein
LALPPPLRGRVGWGVPMQLYELAIRDRAVWRADRTRTLT